MVGGEPTKRHWGHEAALLLTPVATPGNFSTLHTPISHEGHGTSHLRPGVAPEAVWTHLVNCSLPAAPHPSLPHFRLGVAPEAVWTHLVTCSLPAAPHPSSPHFRLGVAPEAVWTHLLTAACPLPRHNSIAHHVDAPPSTPTSLNFTDLLNHKYIRAPV